MRKENPPFRQCFENVFDITIFAGMCFMQTLPCVGTVVIASGYGGVHTWRTHARMSGSRYGMGGGKEIGSQTPTTGDGLASGRREMGCRRVS